MNFRSVVVGFWLLVSTLPAICLACSCAYSVQTGFIHAGKDVHFPSNAKGVLFLVAEGSISWDVTPASFLIRQHDIDSPLLAKVERLDIEDQMEGVHREIKGSKARAGLFRISPVGGFLEGKTYTIKLAGMVVDGSNIWVASIEKPSRYAGSITFTTDPPLLTPPFADISLNAAGSPSGRLMSLPAGGVCSSERGIIAQDLQFAILEAYQPYNRYLLQFVEYRRKEDSSISAKSKYESWVYHSSLCSPVGFGKNLFGPGKDVIVSSCGEKENVGAVEARGYLGFLEMEDRLRATNVLDIDFSTADQSECDPYRTLKEVVNSGDEERIERYLCSISNDSGALRGLSGGFLSELARLAKDKHKRSGWCALAAFVDGTEGLEQISPEVDRSLASIIGADKELVCEISETIWRSGYSGKEPKPRTIAPALQAKLVSLSKDADEKIRNCATHIVYSLVHRVQEIDSTVTKMVFELEQSKLAKAQSADEKESAEYRFQSNVLSGWGKYDRPTARPILLQIAASVNDSGLRCEILEKLFDRETFSFPEEERDRVFDLFMKDLNGSKENNKGPIGYSCAVGAMWLFGERGKIAVPRLLEILAHGVVQGEFEGLMYSLEKLGVDNARLIEPLRQAARSSNHTVCNSAKRKLREIEKANNMVSSDDIKCIYKEP